MRLRRLLALGLLAWAGGFLWFATMLPQPLQGTRSDGIAVPTGGRGRIDRGLGLLRAGMAPKLLISGVDHEVKPREFAAEYRVNPAAMACCIVLGYDSYDTRGNAAEIARWMHDNSMHSVRLVTSDWHMRRASLELRAILPANAVVIEDAVATEPTLRALFLEYHKYLARRIALLWPG